MKRSSVIFTRNDGHKAQHNHLRTAAELTTSTTTGQSLVPTKAINRPSIRKTS